MCWWLLYPVKGLLELHANVCLFVSRKARICSRYEPVAPHANERERQKSNVYQALTCLVVAMPPIPILVGKARRV